MFRVFNRFSTIPTATSVVTNCASLISQPSSYEYCNGNNQDEKTNQFLPRSFLLRRNSSSLQLKSFTFGREMTASSMHRRWFSTAGVLLRPSRTKPLTKKRLPRRKAKPPQQKRLCKGGQKRIARRLKLPKKKLKVVSFASRRLTKSVPGLLPEKKIQKMPSSGRNPAVAAATSKLAPAANCPQTAESLLKAGLNPFGSDPALKLCTCGKPWADHETNYVKVQRLFPQPVSIITTVPAAAMLEASSHPTSTSQDAAPTTPSSPQLRSLPTSNSVTGCSSFSTFPGTVATPRTIVDSTDSLFYGETKADEPHETLKPIADLTIPPASASVVTIGKVPIAGSTPPEAAAAKTAVVGPLPSATDIIKALGITEEDIKTAREYRKSISDTQNLWTGRGGHRAIIQHHVSARFLAQLSPSPPDTSDALLKQPIRILVAEGTFGGGKTKTIDQIASVELQAALRKLPGHSNDTVHTIKIHIGYTPPSVFSRAIAGDGFAGNAVKEVGFHGISPVAMLGWAALYSLVSHRMSPTEFCTIFSQQQTPTGTGGWSGMTFAHGVRLVREVLQLPDNCYTLLAVDDREPFYYRNLPMESTGNEALEIYENATSAPIALPEVAMGAATVEALSVNRVTLIVTTASTRQAVIHSLAESQWPAIVDWLPHPPLKPQDAMLLAKALTSAKDPNTWHPAFRVALSDVGGIPRFIEEVCHRYNRTTPADTTSLSPKMLLPSAKQAYPLVKHLRQDVICAALIPHHWRRFAKVTEAQLSDLCRVGVVSLVYDKDPDDEIDGFDSTDSSGCPPCGNTGGSNTTIQGISIPPFLLFHWATLQDPSFAPLYHSEAAAIIKKKRLSVLAYALRQCLTIDQGASYLTSEKAFEEFLLWYEVARRFSFLRAGISAVSLREFYNGAVITPLKFTPFIEALADFEHCCPARDDEPSHPLTEKQSEAEGGPQESETVAVSKHIGRRPSKTLSKEKKEIPETTAERATRYPIFVIPPLRRYCPFDLKRPDLYPHPDPTIGGKPIKLFETDVVHPTSVTNAAVDGASFLYLFSSDVDTAVWRTNVFGLESALPGDGDLVSPPVGSRLIQASDEPASLYHPLSDFRENKHLQPTPQVVTVLHQMKNVREMKSSYIREIVKEMRHLWRNPSNKGTVGNCGPPVARLCVFFTTNHTQPQAVDSLPPETVFFMYEGMVKYLAPVGKRMLLEWKKEGNE